MKIKVKIIFFLVTLILHFKAQEPLIIAETMPNYQDGMMGVKNYLLKNCVYPSEARENAYSGSAIIQFIVDTTGKILSPRIIKSSGYKCLNDEALRVTNAMPSWNSGYNLGKRVQVYVNLSVDFSINGRVSEFNPKNSMLPKEIIESVAFLKTQKDSMVKLNEANYLFYKGVSLAEDKKYKDALQKFDNCLSKTPEFKDALYNKAVIHFTLGEKDRACETWNKMNLFGSNDLEVSQLIKKHCN